METAGVFIILGIVIVFGAACLAGLIYSIKNS